MPRTTESEGDFEEEDDDASAGDFEYHPEADDPGVFWCPKCSAEMYGDSNLCASCDNYVKPGLKPSTPTPWWIWAGAGIIILLMLAGLVSAMLQSR